MSDSLPMVYLTADDLWEIHCAFARERMALERSFVRLGESCTTAPSFDFSCSQPAEGSSSYDYRYQRRVLAVDSALWEYINATIGSHTGTILRSVDFFHFLRVMKDRVSALSAPPPFLARIQSLPFVQEVSRHQRMVLRMAQAG